MAIKKSQIYSALWAACDVLRGGMDASQYKDYILTLLFVKFISDKANADSVIDVPEGAGFSDMLALRNNPHIGDGLNKIITRLAEANEGMISFSVDFNDDDKLGKGKDKVERLTKLLDTFNDGFELSGNRAGDDDLIGDAYEYLMRKFATKYGKSKGQFYTPAEVSRLLAAVIGIGRHTQPQAWLYDPTCGSGSLLLRAADAVPPGIAVSVHGQEIDNTTAALARMNMVLHRQEEAVIHNGNTIADPLFFDDKRPGALMQFDFVVANPPFSVKNWMSGLTESKKFGRFEYGMPPEKCGDYAFLLHIIASMKPGTGRGACILPHGVLFRSNAEADIRAKLVKHGFIKAIIGLPANLFYGTGIPACVLVLDKSGPAKGIYMIDASKGFMKDGSNNRLREQDLRRIIDTFNARADVPGYARMVPMEEIVANDYNLNIPRYVDTTEEKDHQDIFAHLNGGIPAADVDALERYWQHFAELKTSLFTPAETPGYLKTTISPSELRATLMACPEFATLHTRVQEVTDNWLQLITPMMQDWNCGCDYRAELASLQESLLSVFAEAPLLDKYDVYQKLMAYADETLRDDLYLIATDGWKAETYRVYEEIKQGKKKGEMKDVGWTCDLLPPDVLRRARFAEEGAAVDALQTEVERLQGEKVAMEEEQNGEGGIFAEWEKINATAVNARLKDKSVDSEERGILKAWKDGNDALSKAKKLLKAKEAALDEAMLRAYAALTSEEVVELVVMHKWLPSLRSAILAEVERLAQAFAVTLQNLLERYETPLPVQEQRVAELKTRVQQHLAAMGFAWKGGQV